MLTIISNVFYVLIAVAMTVLILLQRGAGADAGSGFGGGASGTVFGSRGSANFLSRSTAVLAGLFMLISLAMGIWLSRPSTVVAPGDDLGIMGSLAPPAAGGDVPQASRAPTTTAPATTAPTDVSVPAATPASAPVDSAPAEPGTGPGETDGDKDKDAGNE